VRKGRGGRASAGRFAWMPPRNGQEGLLVTPARGSYDVIVLDLIAAELDGLTCCGGCARGGRASRRQGGLRGPHPVAPPLGHRDRHEAGQDAAPHARPKAAPMLPPRSVLTAARTRVEDRVKGLKPGRRNVSGQALCLRELLARVRALVRRKYEARHPSCACRPEIDSGRKTVRSAGKGIELTAASMPARDPRRRAGASCQAARISGSTSTNFTASAAE